MNHSTLNLNALTEGLVLTANQLLDHWQGHRRLTRKLIEAFPEKELFHYSIGGMRPFSALAIEMIEMAGPGIHGIRTGKWKSFGDMKDTFDEPTPNTKSELLRLWDLVTAAIDNLWPQIPSHRFQEHDVAFGMYEGLTYSTLFYFIDNEIHHRGQGYVYLRSLGIEPPAFWDRE